MQKHSWHSKCGVRTRIHRRTAFLLTLGLILLSSTQGSTEGKEASNKHPLSFGKDQTIIDLNKVVWDPLTGDGIPPGAEIAILRGNLAAGGGEALVRFPANYTFPNHSHTSDELYVWLKGDFTYIADDGTATELSGQTYISLPGGVPHALKCGKEPCVFYLRYARPFDYTIHPMPAKKK